MTSIRDRLYRGGLVLGLSFIVAHIYYQDWRFAVGLAPLVYGLCGNVFFSKRINRKLTLAFKLLLNGMYTELLVGQSLRNALVASRTNLLVDQKQFLGWVDELIHDIRYQKSELEAWKTFSNQLDLVICYQFIDVLEVTYRHGGRVHEILRDTIGQLSDQMDLDLEVDLILSAKKYEFYLMMTLPLLMTWVLSLSQPIYTGVLFGTLWGRVVMTGALGLQALAFFLGRQIIGRGM